MSRLCCWVNAALAQWMASQNAPSGHEGSLWETVMRNRIYGVLRARWVKLATAVRIKPAHPTVIGGERFLVYPEGEKRRFCCGA